MRGSATNRPRDGGLPAFADGDAEVARVLLRRRAQGSVPGRRRDGHRVALVVGGGGMRGSYTAGMLRGLERAGLQPAFDEVYGASSGVFGAAAFQAADAEAGAAAYPEDLSSRVFIDPRRLGRRPVVSLEYLVHEVLSVRKPLRWPSLIGAAAPLHVVATDVETMAARVLAPATVGEWQCAVWASASIPLLAGPPVRYAGRRWIDGSVAEPLSTARAVAGGATHVLVLLCRGRDELNGDAGAGLSWWARALDRLVPGLGSVAQGSRRYGGDLALVRDVGDRRRVGRHLLAVAPARSAGVGGLCTDRAALADAVLIGDGSIRAALDRAGAEGGR
ncbi:MAG TPA: patatin-like phospholipase family protein [Pseudonocardia sp.]